MTDLKLDAEQQQRLEPIFAEMRGKFMALREMPEDARAKAGNAIRAELRAQDRGHPEAGTKAALYAEIAAEFSGRAGSGSTTRGRLWVLAGGKPRALEVRVGLSDGSMTEISGEGVSEGWRSSSASKMARQPARRRRRARRRGCSSEMAAPLIRVEHLAKDYVARRTTCACARGRQL